MLRKILAHLTIVFGGMCFVLYVIDAIKGGAMSFINNDITKAFIAILSVLAIINSILLLVAQARETRAAGRNKPRQAAPAAQRTAAPRPTAMPRAAARTPVSRTPAARPSTGTARPAARPTVRTGSVQRPAGAVQRPRSHSSINR